MNALMTSATLQREAGIETIPHVTPRDTTVMGLEGVLLGAHAEGVRNILAVTGDPPHVGDYPGSRGVYEVDSIGLVQLLSALNRGEDYVGKGIDAPTSFFVGVAVNPSADDLELELERFRQKIDAGAHFAMTQALFGVEVLDRFVERLGGAWPIPALVGVWPLRSHAMALRLHNEVPGISVPGAVLSALRDAGPDAPAVGLELARELVSEDARARRGDLRDPSVQAAARCARPLCLAVTVRRSADVRLLASHEVVRRGAERRHHERRRLPARQNRSLRELLTRHGIRHLTTKPYRPRTNGKVERFHQTMPREWAYGLTYRSYRQRNQALPHWLDHYNHQRPHSALGDRPPINRVHNVCGQGD